MKKLALLFAVVTSIALTACGGGGKTASVTETSATTTEAPVQTTVAITEEQTETPEESYNNQESKIDMNAVNDYFQKLLDSEDNPSNWITIGNEDLEVNSEEWKKVTNEWQEKCTEYEEKAMLETAEQFGITPKDVEAIFLGTFSDASDNTSVTIKHGELLSVTSMDSNGIVIKVKIAPSFSNKATIDQNYFNIEDIIKEQDGSQYDIIDYWAVADMKDGSESKVMSFTVNKELIEQIAAGNVVANQYGDYVDDLYILPSLLQ